MDDFLTKIRDLVAAGKARVSDHGFEELNDDDISLADLLASLPNAEIVEEYSDFHKGPCVLVLQRLSDGLPVHVLWGTSKSNPHEATLITAYRPDPDRWSADFLRRLRK